MLAAAKQARGGDPFPRLQAAQPAGGAGQAHQGAVWKFNWTPAGGVQYTVDDIFFAQQTSAGMQDYAIYIRSPQSTFGGTSLPLFDQILPTFQTVPAS